MAREYLWQAEEAGLPSGQFKASAEQFKLPTGMDYSKEKVGLKMPEEPWGITHLAFLYAQEKGKGWAFFLSQNFKYVILDYSNDIPDDIDLLLLGSTIGPSLERQFYVSPKYFDTYKISVIDSYWNIHQRFSNEISGTRWEFSPDEIFVPNLL